MHKAYARYPKLDNRTLKGIQAQSEMVKATSAAHGAIATE